MKDNISFEDYIKEQITEGYIAPNGAPLKCIKCESTNFKDIKIHSSEHGVEEYTVACKECEQINGHWAYGNWCV